MNTVHEGEYGMQASENLSVFFGGALLQYQLMIMKLWHFTCPESFDFWITFIWI